MREKAVMGVISRGGNGSHQKKQLEGTKYLAAYTPIYANVTL
jgi:hypothetical protein